MRRRHFISSAIVALANARAWPTPSPALGPRVPNIIVIVADDLGYADLGIQGCADIPTPHIDSIARNGAKFTDAYVVSPVCSPSRAGLLTGRYPQRFGHEFNPGPIDQAQSQFGLPLSERTLADRLKAVGYATAAIGKWHLGSKPEYHPMRRGFDEFFGFLGGMHPYTNIPGRENMLRGMENVESPGFTTEVFAREAATFIRRNAARPYFVYLAFNAVHEPLEVPQHYRARFKHIRNERRRTFAGMVSAMDDAVGEVLRVVDDTGGIDHTLVFFLSDNGGPTRQTTTRNDPLRGYKGQMYEGGIRVPLLMQWPGIVPKDAVVGVPVSSLDIATTALAAARVDDVTGTTLDGIDLAPPAQGQSTTVTREALYWRYGQQRAVRSGPWKLVQGPTSHSWELYNLETDIGERRNVIADRVEIHARLAALWADWSATLGPPRWKGMAPRREPDD